MACTEKQQSQVAGITVEWLEEVQGLVDIVVDPQSEQSHVKNQKRRKNPQRKAALMENISLNEMFDKDEYKNPSYDEHPRK